MVRHVIFSRSDIFKGRGCTTSDLKARPTNTDLQIPTYETLDINICWSINNCAVLSLVPVYTA